MPPRPGVAGRLGAVVGRGMGMGNQGSAVVVRAASRPGITIINLTYHIYSESSR